MFSWKVSCNVQPLAWSSLLPLPSHSLPAIPSFILLHLYSNHFILLPLFSTLFPLAITSFILHPLYPTQPLLAIFPSFYFLYTPLTPFQSFFPSSYLLSIPPTPFNPVLPSSYFTSTTATPSSNSALKFSTTSVFPLTSNACFPSSHSIPTSIILASRLRISLSTLYSVSYPFIPNTHLCLPLSLSNPLVFPLFIFGSHSIYTLKLSSPLHQPHPTPTLWLPFLFASTALP